MTRPFNHPDRVAEQKYGNQFHRYGCLLDSANPAFFIKGYRDHGRALAADYQIKRGKGGRISESAEEYWARVRREILA